MSYPIKIVRRDEWEYFDKRHLHQILPLALPARGERVLRSHHQPECTGESKVPAGCHHSHCENPGKTDQE